MTMPPPPDHNRRSADKSKVTNFVTNPYAILVHQVITFIAPFVLMTSAWIFVTAFDAYSAKLDKNTLALDDLAKIVGAHNATFSEELIDHSRRLDRLENLADSRYGKSR